MSPPAPLNVRYWIQGVNVKTQNYNYFDLIISSNDKIVSDPSEKGQFGTAVLWIKWTCERLMLCKITVLLMLTPAIYWCNLLWIWQILQFYRPRPILFRQPRRQKLQIFYSEVYFLHLPVLIITRRDDMQTLVKDYYNFCLKLFRLNIFSKKKWEHIIQLILIIMGLWSFF